MIKKLVAGKIGIGIISGAVCFGLGGAIFSDSKTVETLKQDNANLVSKYEVELDDKDKKINQLQSKIDEAKPWFDEQEKIKKDEALKLAEENAKKVAKEEEEKEVKIDQVDTDAIKQTADSIIKKELNDKIADTTLDKLAVNENLGTDSNEDAIVLANLSWSKQNFENTTKDMLKMYSDHLATKLAKELADNSEIALFWDAEYTGLDIKHAYYVKDGKAYKQ